MKLLSGRKGEQTAETQRGKPQPYGQANERRVVDPTPLTLTLSRLRGEGPEGEGTAGTVRGELQRSRICRLAVVNSPSPLGEGRGEGNSATTNCLTGQDKNVRRIDQFCSIALR